MAASKKRRVVNEENNSSDSDASHDSDQNEAENEGTVEVEFEARAPDGSDFHGIKSLLQQLFLKAHVNLSELANLLIQQDYITSVLKQSEPDEMEVDEEEDDDDDCNYGVFSVINIMERKDMECVKQIKSILLDQCKQVSSHEDYCLLKSILEDKEKHVGLIISERFLNIPPKISVPLYDQLSQDIETAKLENKAFNFAYYIIISKLLTFTEGMGATEDTIYANAEEELFTEDAQLMFEFSVSNDQDTGLGGKWTDDDAEGQPKRKVLLLPSSKYPIMQAKLRNELSD